MTLSLDMFQTVALAAVVYFIGGAIRKRFVFFERFCIPAPIVGGLLFSLLALLLRASGLLQLQLDDTLQTLFMNVFFTSIGFTASLRLLRRGCGRVLVFLGVCALLVVLQNVVGVGLAGAFGLEPLLGLCTGSIPMVGGHGTSAAFGSLLEDMGMAGASTVAMAAATFGLLMGSAIGGPLANGLIRRLRLQTPGMQPPAQRQSDAPSHSIDAGRFTHAAALLFLAIGLGSLVSGAFERMGFTFPGYVGAMLVACVIRNIGDLLHRPLPVDEMETGGSVCLALFLSMALMGLRLWELADLALPMLAMMAAQTALIVLFAVLITFRAMGRDYEAAVMVAANCGFGMGATPNAMANMDAVTKKYGFAPQAFFIVPLVGGLFIDFFNSTVIMLFINLLAR